VAEQMFLLLYLTYQQFMFVRVYESPDERGCHYSWVYI